jgi:hypothetical protein
MTVTDAAEVDEVAPYDTRHGLFGIDLGVQVERVPVAMPSVISEPVLVKRPPRTLTDRLAEAAADRVRWGRPG